MTNNYVNKLGYIFSPIVQNKVQWGGYYLLTNLKVNSFLHEIKGGRSLCKKNKQY